MRAFPAIRIEGGLLGPETLDQLLAAELPGQRQTDFALDVRRSLTDEIAAAFADARALWGVFRQRLERLPETDMATSPTRDGWVVPFLGLLGYELRYNQRAYEVDGLTFAVSHRAGEDVDAPPVHIVGARQGLGRAPESGRPRLAPHSLVQEYLNRTEQLWGLVTNGITLRLLRDSTFIRRQTYVEFDLKAMLEEQRFEDFVALFRLLHRTRLPQTVAEAHTCLLESYYQHAVEQGGRVRDRLRDGVEEAIKLLANGFLKHTTNESLRRRVKPDCADPDRIAPSELYRQLLRLVYRFLFLLVGEERGLISASSIYREHYSVSRLRQAANRRSAYDDYDDLWQSLRVLWRALAEDRYAMLLEAAPLNGELFEPLVFDDSVISNRDLLEAFVHLDSYREGASLRRVNYAALDVEELGSVYESLLDYDPHVDHSEVVPRFELATGSERKSTGSYYTPPELVAELIRSALEPVMGERLKAARTREDRKRALLSIRVLDPACGSGHFLLAAARTLARELARVCTGGEEPPPEAVREAIRDVVRHCIYGVDRNPLAVELCRVALWLEAHSAGKPLAFLDHRIRCGDSLVGVFDLKVLRQGIPDEAFTPLEGDDRALASEWKKRNQRERSGIRTLGVDADTSVSALVRRAIMLDTMPDDTPEHVREKQKLFGEMQAEPGAVRQRMACDLWTAAFFQPLQSAGPAITTDVVRQILEDRAVHGQTIGQAQAMALRHRFFHWFMEFPEVFAEGGRFDVVLCNPPWERIKLQEQEFFAARDPEIARAPNAAARRRLIAALEQNRPALAQEYRQALHDADAASKFLRTGGRYPLTGRGDINTYSVFAELGAALVGPLGRVGIVLPTGIATDATNQYFFRHLVRTGRLAALYDFENRKGIFPGVHRSYKFCLLTLRGQAGDGEPAEFAFFCHEASDLRDAERRFALSPEDFRLLNPNTGTAPIFRGLRDADLTKAIYRRVPVLIEEAKGAAGNPWGVEFLRMLDMANDSGIFRTRNELEAQGYRLEGNVFARGAERWMPLYEAKMIHQFDHRFGDYRDPPEGSKSTQLPDVPIDRLADPTYQPLPRYWVPEEEVEHRLDARGWERGWLLGWRDIARSTDERTVIAAVIPRVGVGNTMPVFLVQGACCVGCLPAMLASYVLDYATRQKVGGTHLTYNYVQQLPVLPPSVFAQPCPWSPGETIADWLRPRVLELTYTAWDLKPFAEDLGYDGPPFRYDPERRFQLRAELDAAFFILYLGTAEEWQREASAELKALFPTPRDAVEYILEQFPIVRRKDEARCGTYRTKDAILAEYDALLERGEQA